MTPQELQELKEKAALHTYDNECWKPVQNGELFVSKSGCVLKKGGYVKGKRQDYTKVLPVYLDKDCMPWVKSESSYQVHKLVAEAFLGKKYYDHKIIHHKDNNGLNNSVENLILVTAEEHGAIHSGIKNNLTSDAS